MHSITSPTFSLEYHPLSAVLDFLFRRGRLIQCAYQEDNCETNLLVSFLICLVLCVILKWIMSYFELVWELCELEWNLHVPPCLTLTKPLYHSCTYDALFVQIDFEIKFALVKSVFGTQRVVDVRFRSLEPWRRRDSTSLMQSGASHEELVFCARALEVLVGTVRLY